MGPLNVKDLLLAARLDRQQASELLRPYGFKDAVKADTNLQAMADDPSERHALAVGGCPRLPCAWGRLQQRAQEGCGRHHDAPADDKHLVLDAGQCRQRRRPSVRAQPGRTGRFGHHMRNASIPSGVVTPLVSAGAERSG